MASMIFRLQRIIQEVSRSPDIQHALDLIAQSLIADLVADACTIFLVTDDDPPVLVLKSSYGLNPDIIGHVTREFGQGLIGMVAARAESINLTKAPDHKDFILVPDSGEAEFPIYLGVPIISHRKVLGVIAIQRAQQAFNEDDEAFLTTLAAQLATSIEHAESQGRFRLIGSETPDQSSHMVRGVAGSPGMAIGQAIVLNRGDPATPLTSVASMIFRLQRIIQEVSRSPDIQHALDLIAQSLIADLVADACTIFLVTDDDPPVLVLKSSYGLNPDIIGHVTREFGQGLIGMVAARAESINLTKAPDHKDFILVPDSGEAEFPIYLGVPIISHRKVLGVIAIQRAQQAFNEDDEAFLTTLAAQLATSIEHAESQGRFRLIGSETPDQSSHMVRGVAGSPGMAIGQAIVLNRGVNLESVPDKKIEDRRPEIKNFDDAVRKVQEDLTLQAERMRTILPEEECALFIAYAQMLNSGSLIDDTYKRIEQGNWSAASWRDTIEEHAHVFEQMEDEYLAERANDIRDLGRRVLRKLMLEQSTYINFPERTVLVGDEISATDLADVPPDCLCGIVSAHGSGSSHVAILAHALGIPAVMGVPNLPVKQMDGLQVVVDGYSGCAFIDPNENVLAEYGTYLEEEEEIEQDLLSLKNEPALTLDNHRISLYVNSGLMADHSPSLRSGAEGVGLYRTEIPFQIRDRFPTEEEQYQIYSNVLRTFSGMREYRNMLSEFPLLWVCLIFRLSRWMDYKWLLMDIAAAPLSTPLFSPLCM